jgi:hypothetical protein
MAQRLFALVPVLAFFATDAASAGDEYEISAEARKHWAWQPPVRRPAPAVDDPAWSTDAIDAFVYARLKAAGLRPAAPATREQLIRRVTFDLIGLPPTPAEIDAFVGDGSPQAWANVVDRLLGSPHYGERWGRHWLDLARFAESNGFEFDEARPNAWRWRDYVIRSFNADKPFDRFVKEQIAGDELYPDDPDAITATGFNLLGADMTDASDQKQRRQNTLNDMTETVGLVFLGMTVGCARCHDHKFEPIPQADFYRLQAFFTPAVFRLDLPAASKAENAAYETASARYLELTRSVREAIRALEEPHRAKLYAARLATLTEEAQVAHKTPEDQRTPEQVALASETGRQLTVTPAQIVGRMSPEEKARHKSLAAELKKFDPHKPSRPTVMGLQNGRAALKTFLLERGELSEPGEEVGPGSPIVMKVGGAPAAALPDPAAPAGRRSALAGWLASPRNPLTARVLVNRLWQHHFGRGLVATASDFGVRGAAPTHPELLDNLALDFVEGGWSIKRMHRRMLLSAAYRQSATPSADALLKDPDNKLLSRMNRQRLEGEIVRDALLAVGGRLNTALGGPSVYPPIPAEALKGVKGWTTSPDPADHVRRSVYIFARRNLKFPFLEAFDLPDSNLSCPKRERSTTAPQALALLNSSDVVEAAAALAARVTRGAATVDERIALAFRIALGRRPSEAEAARCREFLTGSPLSELCRALLNTNEFVYLD